MIGVGLMTLGSLGRAKAAIQRKPAKDPVSTVYRAVNGSPRENMEKVVEMLGGIRKIIGPEDMVVIKPNVQWWNQGAPNLAAVQCFVEMVLEMSGGFHGEVIIAENCHRGASPWSSKSSGWVPPFERNSDIPDIHNYNDLTGSLKKRYADRFSTVHWIDVDAGARRVYGPKDGDGYVYCDGTGGVPLLSCGNGLSGEQARTTIMTYPVFTTGQGRIVDFKNGVWQKNSYTGQPLRFVNFAALNNHSISCGVTSAIKNYLGVTDLSNNGNSAKARHLTDKYVNFHGFPLNEDPPKEQVQLLGAEVSAFMKTVRKADLNITTAEWIGLASRTEPPVARTRAILASTDPVALDYHATRYLLYPNSSIAHHNPDNARSPLYRYLARCAADGGGVFDEARVAIESYDLKRHRLQKDDELPLIVDKIWGSNPKILAKYFALRLGLI